MQSVVFQQGRKNTRHWKRVVSCRVWAQCEALCLLCFMLVFVLCCNITLSKEWIECIQNPFLRPILPLPVSFLVSLFLTSGSGSLFHSVLYSNTILNYSSFLARSPCYSCYFILSIFTECPSRSFFVFWTLANGSEFYLENLICL